MSRKTVICALVASIGLLSNVIEAESNFTTMEEDDEWYLKFTNSSLGNHTDALDGLVLEYHVAKYKTEEQLTSSIYDESCLTLIDDASVTVSDPILEEMVDMDYDAGAVSVDIDFETIKNSTFWDSDSETTGVISFCVKTELWSIGSDAYNESSVSVSFSDTVVHSSIDFEAGFTTFDIEGIQLIKFNATEVEETSQVEATACICDDANVCEEDPVLAQNSAFNICVNPEGEGLEVTQFKALGIYQDGVEKFIPITDGMVTSSITEVFPGAIGVIKTRMVSVFFESSDPMDVMIAGAVVLDFAAERSLEENDSRALKRNPKAVFQVKVGLDGLDKSSIQRRTPQFHMIVGVFLVLQVFVLTLLLNRRREGNDYITVSTDEEATD